MGDQVSYPRGLFYAIIALLAFTTITVTYALLLTGEIGTGWILLLAAFLALETIITGISPMWGGVSSEGGNLHVRVGYLFRMSIPMERLEHVDTFTGKMPIYLRYGVHFAPRRTVAAIMSMNDIVEIRTKEPVRGYMHGFPVKVQRFYISVNDPVAVVDMVGPVLGKE